MPVRHKNKSKSLLNVDTKAFHSLAGLKGSASRENKNRSSSTKEVLSKKYDLDATKDITFKSWGRCTNFFSVQT